MPRPGADGAIGGAGAGAGGANGCACGAQVRRPVRRGCAALPDVLRRFQRPRRCLRGGASPLPCVHGDLAAASQAFPEVPGVPAAVQNRRWAAFFEDHVGRVEGLLPEPGSGMRSDTEARRVAAPHRGMSPDLGGVLVLQREDGAARHGALALALRRRALRLRVRGRLRGRRGGAPRGVRRGEVPGAVRALRAADRGAEALGRAARRLDPLGRTPLAAARRLGALRRRAGPAGPKRRLRGGDVVVVGRPTEAQATA
mmetsp:Transcript_35361/g.94161  ORF Transcript_35361/g.94161 Transcript_35361/m.94161 type:complete len:256 (-) Transcript_35361:311-1078(-)